MSESDMLLYIIHLKRGNKWHRLNIIKNKFKKKRGTFKVKYKFGTETN